MDNNTLKPTMATSGIQGAGKTREDKSLKCLCSWGCDDDEMLISQFLNITEIFLVLERFSDSQ